MDLKGKVVVVTGASKGLGKELCKQLNHLGAIIIGIYNNTLVDYDICDKYKCDICSEEQIKLLFNAIKDKYKYIDVLINCAAICIDEDYLDKTKEHFMKVLETNLVGTFLMIKFFSQIMLKGYIINVSSTDAIDAYSVDSMDYGASKAGIINLTQNFANRLKNITFLSIAPDFIDTESVLDANPNYIKEQMNRVKQKQLLKKEDVAKNIIDIISKLKYKSGDVIKMENRYE